MSNIGLVLVAMVLSVKPAIVDTNHSVVCRCHCQDGFAKTRCIVLPTLETDALLCPQRQTCKKPLPGAKSNLYRHAVLARNCQAVRVWHRRLQAYTSVDLCELSPLNVD